MPFSPSIKESALVASGRCCCLCHQFCGTKIEVHHILHESDGGENALDNALPLCLNCHADMMAYDANHPIGNKYSVRELKQHRDNWYNKITGNVGIADISEIVETDKLVFKKILEILPWERSINFLRTNNFAGYSFDLSTLDDLYEFEILCRNPLYEFVDPDLEAQKAKLNFEIDSFTSLIAKETFPADGNYLASSNYNAVPDEWNDEQPKRFERVVMDLHNNSSRIVEVYRAFVRTAIRKLGVFPVEMN